MKRHLIRAAVAVALGGAVVVWADSNQLPATQPTTQSVLNGRVLSTATATPATMPTNKSPVYTPAYGTADGGGNKASSLLLNGGIGPTVVPAGGNTGVQTGELPGVGEPGRMQAPASQPTAR